MQGLSHIATFQVLSRHLWLVTIVPDIENSPSPQNILWDGAALEQASSIFSKTTRLWAQPASVI